MPAIELSKPTASTVSWKDSLVERGERCESYKTDVIEIAEALVLTIVDVATAWSGYRVARLMR